MHAPRTLIVLLIVVGPLFGARQLTAPTQQPSKQKLDQIEAKRAELEKAVQDLKAKAGSGDLLSDVQIYIKAAEWIVRHGEFYSDKYSGWTIEGLERGLARAQLIETGRANWPEATGRLSRGFVSKVDRSLQPYGLVIPTQYSDDPSRKWRLDVELHGRGNTLNEVSFLHAHDLDQPVPKDQDFIQLDIFGRGNNAYRWAGETDVFEAIESVKKRYRIDERRVVLRGFSMGGAGSWHLGLHHPDEWCSVGPGAGFTDTKKYQKITASLPAWQEATLHIYDAEDYTLNAFDVPIVAYGGENDPQLEASHAIQKSLAGLGVKFTADGLNASTTDIPFLYLVGPGMGHQFHPESRTRAMQFHAEHATAGMPYFRDRVRFLTYTLKYPGAFGYTIRQMGRHYSPATIEAARGADGVIDLKTENVTVLELSRGVGSQVRIGGEVYDIETAADGQLPTVLFQKRENGWELMDYVRSLGELGRNFGVKRPGLQGPIDDAFTGPFVCVRGTGEPWSSQIAGYSNWALDRFAREWDKWLRAALPLKSDSDVSDDDIRDSNLILFGDPGSNGLIRDVAARLPLKWSKGAIEIGGRSYSTADHVPVLIAPNPLNARRYVVINSGHTFHEAEFKASNAQLYPRLGDFAVLKLGPSGDGGYNETAVEAGILDEHWQFPRR